MTDKPIIFSAPMVRALLDGRKTQTRRVVKIKDHLDGHTFTGDLVDYYGNGRLGMVVDGSTLVQPIPYAPGDRLYVRERFAISGIGWGKKPKDAIGGKVHYFADPENGWLHYWGSGHPSIHMPRWASRLTLTVTDVRVQRLIDISNEDARSEGSPFWWRGLPEDQRAPTTTAVGMFRDLWNSLHGPDAWAANPWVVALTFDVYRGNIDRVQA